tara:strand:+ start:122 stop:367 length:246 start_codon:yes stop_codon:yes gene_type:complete
MVAEDQMMIDYLAEEGISDSLHITDEDGETVFDIVTENDHRSSAVNAITKFASATGNEFSVAFWDNADSADDEADEYFDVE